MKKPKITYVDFSKTDFFNESDFEAGFSSHVEQLENWMYFAEKWQRWKQSKHQLQTTIPRIVHQVWMGSPFPDKYRQWAESWLKMNPGWEYHLWTEEKLLQVFTPDEKEWFDAATNFGPKSDLARYVLLKNFGGIYCDTDFECLKSFEDIIKTTTFFAGTIFNVMPEINGAITGAVKGHPLIVKTCQTLVAKKHTQNNSRAILYGTGPQFFTRVILENKDLLEDSDVIFPTHYLYPLPNYCVTEALTLKNIQEKYIKEKSLAIHYWEVSWENDSFVDKSIYMLKKIIKKIIFYEKWRRYIKK